MRATRVLPVMTLIWPPREHGNPCGCSGDIKREQPQAVTPGESARVRCLRGRRSETASGAAKAAEYRYRLDGKTLTSFV